MRKKILRVGVFWLLFLVLFSKISGLLRDKQRDFLLQPFYKLPKNSVDIVMLGASNIYTSLLPMELWKEFGYTSFNLGTSMQTIPFSYYLAEDAIQTQQPSLIILDVNTAGAAPVPASAFVHGIVDNMQRLSTKTQAILTLTEKEDWLRYFVSIYEFHSRWKELKMEEFVTGGGYYYGAKPYYNKTAFQSSELLPASETKELEETNYHYLKKLISLCKETDTKLLLIAVPSYAAFEQPDRQRYFNKIQEIASEETIPFLNLLTCMEQIPFDLSRDMADLEHCNLLGAYRLTSYIGRYLNENLGYHNWKDISENSNWNQNYSYWLKETLPQLKDIITYLEKIQNGNYDIYITLGGGLKKVSWPIKKALEQLGLTQFRNSDDWSGKTYLAVIHQGEVVLELQDTKTLTKTFSLSGHEIQLSSEAIRQSIQFDGIEQLRQDCSGLGIVLYDTLLDEVVDRVIFDINNHSIPYR